MPTKKGSTIAKWSLTHLSLALPPQLSGNDQSPDAANLHMHADNELMGLTEQLWVSNVIDRAGGCHCLEGLAPGARRGAPK